MLMMRHEGGQKTRHLTGQCTDKKEHRDADLLTNTRGQVGVAGAGADHMGGNG